MAAAQRHERDFIHAALLQGSVALVAGELVRAEERLHHALTRTRAVNVVEFELAALIAIAELALKRGDPASARASLGDVWEAAERGPYRLRQADAFGVLADIELAEGRKEAAIAAATEAFKAAWCDGPPYAYHRGLGEAKAQLAALGATEPVLPPFDESKFAPMPTRSTQRTKTGSTRTSWTDFRRRSNPFAASGPEQRRHDTLTAEGRVAQPQPKQGAEKLGPFRDGPSGRAASPGLHWRRFVGAKLSPGARTRAKPSISRPRVHGFRILRAKPALRNDNLLAFFRTLLGRGLLTAPHPVDTADAYSGIERNFQCNQFEAGFGASVAGDLQVRTCTNEAALVRTQNGNASRRNPRPCAEQYDWRQPEMFS